MKRILLFGAGKSATSLIHYLVGQTALRGWELIVAESNLSLAQSKIGTVPGAKARAVSLQVEKEEEREGWVRDADIVISLLPPTLHFLVAASCVKWGKDLLTASYLDDKIKALEPAIREKGLLFLCEMGLDPGIDHMSAMQLIHGIRKRQGRILSFQSHTGGLVAPESDDNPWHYKISWNPRNIVLAGSAGARYKEDNVLVSRSYEDLFENNKEIDFPEIGALAWYPNRDSLSYIPVYGLEDAAIFIRTTLRHPAFCRAWLPIVRAGLTNDQVLLDPKGWSFAKWSAPLLPLVNAENRKPLEFLGLFEDLPVPSTAKTSADILQYLLETRLIMQPADKDMIVMRHEIQYELPVPGKEPGSAAVTYKREEVTSSLIVKGEDHLRTAMAKTVGLPLGIAALWILEGKITLTGLHIPILPEIYEPVLKELAVLGVEFEETVRVLS